MKITELVNRIGGVRLIQVTIDLWNSIFLIIIFLLVLNSYKKEKSQRSISRPIPLTTELLTLCASVLTYEIFDAISLIFNGNEGTVERIWKTIGEYGYFFTGIFLMYFLLSVLKKCIAAMKEKKKLYNFATALQSLQIINLSLLITNPVSKKLFTIDSNNFYSRGELYRLWSVVNILSLAMSMIICTVLFKKMTLFQKRIVCVAVIISFAASIINLFFFTISIHCICASLITLFMFISYSKNRTNIIMENAVKIEKIKTELMLSQISPHFIQNSITAIIYYADKDTEKTRSALINFSKYLRKNIDYKNLTELVPIEDEIEHAKVYLSLEELRFGDDLKVVFDLNTKSFSLPSLTVQPIVENAVKHGIKNSESGCGTVIIKTAETDDNYIIKVTDDGAGLDIDTLKSLDTTHTGIRNVKTRLMLFCGGDFSLESKNGQGTVCTITIPKSEDRNENINNG